MFDIYVILRMLFIVARKGIFFFLILVWCKTLLEALNQLKGNIIKVLLID